MKTITSFFSSFEDFASLVLIYVLVLFSDASFIYQSMNTLY